MTPVVLVSDSGGPPVIVTLSGVATPTIMSKLSKKISYKVSITSVSGGLHHKLFSGCSAELQIVRVGKSV